MCVYISVIMCSQNGSRSMAHGRPRIASVVAEELEPQPVEIHADDRHGQQQREQAAIVPARSPRVCVIGCRHVLNILMRKNIFI